MDKINPMPTIVLLPTFQSEEQRRGDKMAHKQAQCLQVRTKFIRRVLVSDILTIVAMLLMILHLLGVV